MLIDGEAFFYQSGVCVPLRTGDLIIYGTMTPYLYGMTRPSRHIQIDIAAAELGETGGACELKAPVKIDGSLRAGRLLTQAMRRDMLEFIDAPQADRIDAVSQRLRTTLQVLIRAQAADRASGVDLATLRLLRAEAFIAEHLCDAQLDVDAVARHLSVSPRHLNRLFEQHGCSVGHWIWRERLARAIACSPTRRTRPYRSAMWRCSARSDAIALRARVQRALRRHAERTPRRCNDDCRLRLAAAGSEAARLASCRLRAQATAAALSTRNPRRQPTSKTSPSSCGSRKGKTWIGSVRISPPLNLSLGSGPSDAAA